MRRPVLTSYRLIGVDRYGQVNTYACFYHRPTAVRELAEANEGKSNWNAKEYSLEVVERNLENVKNIKYWKY